MSITSAAASAATARPNWLTGCASDAILLEVRPQLGHVDKETSEMYLVWVAGAFSKSTIYEEYDAFLEDIVTDKGAD